MTPKTDGTDSGLHIDALAQACGRWTYNEMDWNNIEYRDESIKTAAEEYDHRADYIATLKQDMREGFRKQIEAGYYDALNEEVARHKKRNMEQAEQYPDMQFVTESFKKALQDAEDAHNEYTYNLWLKGDRSEGGVLWHAGKKLGEVLTAHYKMYYDRKSDTVSIEMNDDELKNELEAWNEYAEENGEKKARSASGLGERLSEWMDYERGKYLAKEKEAAEKRRAEHERVRKYQEEVAQARKESEHKKLLAALA